MASGSTGAGKTQRMAAYGKSQASKRGSSMKALASRNNGSNTPF